MSLTPGAISRLTQNDTNGQPIVQIIDHKMLGGASGNVRHRLVISDGQAFMQAMLATQLNQHIDNGSVRPPRAPRSLVRPPHRGASLSPTCFALVSLLLTSPVSDPALRAPPPVPPHARHIPRPRRSRSSP